MVLSLMQVVLTTIWSISFVHLIVTLQQATPVQAAVQLENSLLIAIIAASATVLTAVLSFTAVLLNLKQNAKIALMSTNIDGRLTQLLESVKAQAHAEGLAAGNVEGAAKATSDAATARQEDRQADRVADRAVETVQAAAAELQHEAAKQQTIAADKQVEAADDRARAT